MRFLGPALVLSLALLSSAAAADPALLAAPRKVDGEAPASVRVGAAWH